MNDILSMMKNLMNNPMQVLMQKGFNLPENIGNNPQAIIQHLLNTNQITQDQLNQAMQMRGNPMFKGLFK